MDPTARLRGAFVTGIFTGRLLRYARDGQVALVAGLAGPHRVAIPVVLFKQRPAIGDVVSYIALAKPGVRLAVGVRVVRTRGMQ